MKKAIITFLATALISALSLLSTCGAQKELTDEIIIGLLGRA